jgi:hypothetical protein
MPESLDRPSGSTPMRNGAGDGQVLEHVEKWMAMIREIKSEQQDQTKHRN